MKTAIAYYRTASIDPESLSDQQNTVRDWAATHSIQIIDEFVDHGTSGLDYDLGKRQGFLDFLYTKVFRPNEKFDCVLMQDPIRISRSDEFLQVVKKKINDAGRKIMFTSRETD